MISFKNIKLGSDIFGTKKSKEENKNKIKLILSTRDEAYEDDEDLEDDDCYEDIIDYDGNLIADETIISIVDNLIVTKNRFTVFDIAVVLTEDGYVLGRDILNDIDEFLVEYFMDNYNKYRINRAIKGEYHEFTIGDLEGEMVNAVSSFIQAFSYHSKTKNFVIIMNDKVYSYTGVDYKTYKGFLEAKSKGEFFNQNIKDKY